MPDLEVRHLTLGGRPTFPTATLAADAGGQVTDAALKVHGTLNASNAVVTAGLNASNATLYQQ